MKKSKNIKYLLFVGLLVLLGFGSTVAYFYASKTIDNEFRTSEPKIYLYEKFAPGERWIPGEEKQKEVRFGNDGNLASVLRVKFTPALKLEDGTEDKEAVKDFKLNFAEIFMENWEKHGEWYYYKKVLSPDEKTDITLKSVTISNNIGNNEHNLENKIDYSNAFYEVNIEGELLQTSLASEGAKADKWEMIPVVTGNKVVWNEN